MKTKDTQAQAFGRQSAKPSQIKGWSTHNSSYHCTVHHRTQYCSTETVLLIFAFLRTNMTYQMGPSLYDPLLPSLHGLMLYKTCNSLSGDKKLMVVLCRFQFSKTRFRFGFRHVHLPHTHSPTLVSIWKTICLMRTLWYPGPAWIVEFHKLSIHHKTRTYLLPVDVGPHVPNIETESPPTENGLGRFRAVVRSATYAMHAHKRNIEKCNACKE